MVPIVLVHGGGFDHRCWDLLLPHLDGPIIAVDLPGRGRHPAPMESVTLAACAQAVADDVDGAGFDEIVLVGHSLAGCSMPATLRRPFPRTWVRTLQDAIMDPDKQLRFAANVGHCEVIDLDAAHMAMISQPSGLARILNGIVAAP